jgi:copper chaperone CopZ
MQAKTTAISNVTIPVAGMSCGSCVRHIKGALGQKPGVKAVDVNLAGGKVTVSYSPASTDVEGIVQAIGKSGYRVGTPIGQYESWKSKTE